MHLFLAVGTDAVELESVTVDAVTALGTDFADDGLQAAVRYFNRRSAAATDDVVVVLLGRTGDVGVLARWKVQSFQGALLGEQVEGPKNRRSADLEVCLLRVGKQVRGSEVTVALGDQCRHGAPWCRLPRVDTRSHHGVMIPNLR